MTSFTRAIISNHWKQIYNGIPTKEAAKPENPYTGTTTAHTHKDQSHPVTPDLIIDTTSKQVRVNSAQDDTKRY